MAADEYDRHRTRPADETERDELSDLVDDLEEKVETERVDSGRPGNAEDRARTRRVEPNHQAPD